MKAARCTICLKEFKSSTFWFLMMKCDFPTTCSACRLSDRKKQRDELNDAQYSIVEAINPEECLDLGIRLWGRWNRGSADQGVLGRAHASPFASAGGGLQPADGNLLAWGSL